MVKTEAKNRRDYLSTKSVQDRLNQMTHLFFGMNPANKFWLLEVLLIAKRGELFIVDNEIDKDDHVLCKLDMDLLRVTGGTSRTMETWKEKGIYAKYAVGRTSTEIRSLLNKIEEAFTERSRNSHSIFDIKQMEPIDLFEIVEIISSLPREWFEDGVAMFTDKILATIARNGGKRDAEFYQPREVTGFMMSILDIKEGSVYNPFAGLASYGTLLNANVEYHAQEISQMYLIAKLNLLLHGKDDSNCEQGDSIKEWNDRKFDYIVATPPFNARVNSNAKDSIGQYRETMEAVFLDRARRSFQKKAAVIVTGHFCAANGGYSFAIKKNLVEKDLVESVIMLPDNLFFGTVIPTYVIVLNKNKEHKGKIRFANVSSCYEKQSVKNVLTVDSALSLAFSDDKYHTALVDNAVFYANDCSLVPSKYIARMLPDALEGEVYMPLSQLLSPYSKQRVELTDGVYPIVNFPANELQLSVKSADFPKKELKESHVYNQISDDCIIIDTRFQLRSVYVEKDGIPAYVLPSYHTFVVNTSIVLPEYLVIQLRSAYAARQIIVSRVNVLVKTEDLLSTLILIPSLEEQKKAVYRYKEKHLQDMGVQLNDLYEKKLNDFLITQRERKHAVSQVLGDILPAIELIDNFIHCTESFNKDSVVSRRGTTFEHYVSSLVKNVNKVADMVSHFTDNDKFHEAETIHVVEALHRYFEGKLPKGYVVYLDVQDEQDLYVSISEQDFHQILDNLLNNAEKYGFVDKERQDYKVKISVSSSEGGEKLIMHIRNNGVPASEGFDISKIFAWGEGHGSGIGCNQVKEIVEHFGGTVEYHENTDDPDGFICDFMFVLPLIKDMEDE